jgi:YD repeat-containing protein
MTSPLHALPQRARVSSLVCSLFISLTLARLARRPRASRPRRRPARARYAHSGFRRFACLLMVTVMFAQFVFAPPEASHAAVKAVSATAVNSAQDARHWWHASGWAASSERFLRRIWDGKGAKRRAASKPKPQETQEERNGRVARVEISPREATIAAGQEIHFIAVAYDSNNSPVGGVSFDWDKEDEATGERASAEESGKFSSANGRFSSPKEGNFRVKARFGGIEASAKVKVKGVRRSSGQQPIGTRTVSSRDLPQQSRSSLSPPATKDRIAKNAPGRLATRYSSGGTRAMPRLLPLLPDEYSWNDGNHWSADDPGMERGNPPGRKPDGGAGSGNFHFAAPVLAYEGRGLDLNVGMAYNSRIWHKVNSDITFDIDHDWPAVGWSLGFGKIVGMGLQNGYMLIDPDGTRHSYDGTLTVDQLYQTFKGHTTDGSFIDLDVTGFNAANGGAPETGFAYFPNGTLILYGAPGSNAIYPVYIEDANGNMIWISYRNNHGPQIETVTDPLGRVSQFHYDSSNLLTAITAPGFDGSTRTAVRLHYRDLTLDAGSNYGFTGLTTHVRQSTVPVIDAIYYPATGTGYWFGDLVSYSSYGMLNKIIEQRGMSFIDQGLTSQGIVNQGSMTRQMVYDYPMTSSGLTDTPTYQTMTETWAGMTVPAAETQYDVHENDSPRRVVITRPGGVKTVMLSHNTPGQFTDGLIYQDETRTPEDALLGKSFVQWEQGDYGSPRPSRVEATDERGQTTGKELSYGPRFNQMTEIREYDYGYSHGGANTLLRKTVNQYLNNSNYTDPLSGGAYWRHIFNLPTLNEVYAGDGVTRLARTEYSYDEFTGAAGLQNTPDIVYSGHDLAFDPYVPGAYNPITEYRGNVTTVKRYANAETLDEDTAVVEIRHYDITGNVRKVETSCCEQTTINYTVDTQYAWPESQISGSPTDPNKRNTNCASFLLSQCFVGEYSHDRQRAGFSRWRDRL